ncbi:transposase, mutator type [Streptomyces lincolnensis]|uniref:Transposase, mutator type n=1 Tax=Streptomyces lincolnensis TaxID=1915 RepID=A0A1B1MHJ7_STRLN|nr:transposase, mutator type [Streptomyces lincolnensis]AXG53750.1 transposase, mutator type [Streptomyces lincolnensis]
MRLDEPLTAFRNRPLDHIRIPNVHLDATYCTARVQRQIPGGDDRHRCQRGRRPGGPRRWQAGDSETETSLAEFLRHPRERGLDVDRLVIADHHSGRIVTVRKAVIGAACQTRRLTSCAASPARSRRTPLRWSPRRSAQSSPAGPDGGRGPDRHRRRHARRPLPQVKRMLLEGRTT